MAEADTPRNDPPRARRWASDDPPAPVLPPNSRLSAEGRHFSADELPADWESPLPRRSAATPTEWNLDAVGSPEPPDAGAAGAASAGAGSPATTARPDAGAARPTDATSVRVSGASPATGTAASGSSASTPPARRPGWVLPVAGVGALALAAAIGVPWWNAQQAAPGASTPSVTTTAAAPTPSGTTDAAAAPPAAVASPTASEPAAAPSAAAVPPAAAPSAAAPVPGPTEAGLLAPAALGGLRANATWSAVPPAADAAARQADLRCATATTSAQTQVLRSAGADPITVVQQLERFPTVQAAQQAFASRSAELGGCAATPDLVQQGYTVTGLGEQATGVQALQQGPGVPHQVLLVRAGTAVVVTDALAGKSPVAMDALARAVATTLPGTGGTPAVTPAVPAPGGLPGFLAAGDLPQVTAGTGQWVGAQIKPMALASGGCEQVDLTKPAGGQARGQQAFLLTEDPKASARYGLDEIVYTFSTPDAAKAFTTTLSTQLSTCGQRQKTMTVRTVGQAKAPASGTSYLVEDRKTLNSVARSRVLVGAVGNRAVYLRSNGTAQFDLSDAAWTAVLQRALDRAQQLPG